MSESKFLRYWRPAMGWSYLVICLWDFLIAPIFFAWYAHYFKISFEPWKPLTLSESGLYHVAMGAIVGVATWSRGQEKMTILNLSANSSSEEIKPIP